MTVCVCCTVSMLDTFEDGMSRDAFSVPDTELQINVCWINIDVGFLS